MSSQATAAPAIGRRGSHRDHDDGGDDDRRKKRDRDPLPPRPDVASAFDDEDYYIIRESTFRPKFHVMIHISRLTSLLLRRTSF